jgi:hypothetical protein
MSQLRHSKACFDQENADEESPSPTCTGIWSATAFSVGVKRA